MKATSTLTSKGQVTIPERIRRRLGLKRGDRLEFRVDDEGQIRLRRVEQAPGQAVIGMLRRYAQDPAVTVNEMREAVRKRASHKSGPDR